MTTYTNHEQRMLDQQSGMELDRAARRASSYVLESARRAGILPPAPVLRWHVTDKGIHELRNSNGKLFGDIESVERFDHDLDQYTQRWAGRYFSGAFWTAYGKDFDDLDEAVTFVMEGLMESLMMEGVS